MALIEGSLVGVFVGLSESAYLMESSLPRLSISSRGPPPPSPRSAAQASNGRPPRHPISSAPPVGCGRPLSSATRRLAAPPRAGGLRSQ
jgi:hypothetical protein